MPLEVVKNLPEELETGIYFGWASVENGDVHKAVLSIGWNPFYHNKEKSMVCIRNLISHIFVDKIHNFID